MVIMAMAAYEQVLGGGFMPVREDLNPLGKACDECGAKLEPSIETKYFCKGCRRHYDKYHFDWHCCQVHTPDGDTLAFG